MFANRPLGLLSPRDTARTTLAGADLWVDYGRPMKRGRVIFGDVVPWNSVWRTGANAATQFNTPVDLVIGGAKVPAGRYTLWTLPSQTGWKVIFNQQTGQWGTEYHEEQDLARVDARVETLAAAVEQLFKVKVADVRTANQVGKLRRHGRSSGYRSDWKKAYVTLKAGQKMPEYAEI